MMKKYDVSLRDACERVDRTIEKLESLKGQIAELERDILDPEAVDLIREVVNVLDLRTSYHKICLMSLTGLAERYETD